MRNEARNGLFSLSVSRGIKYRNAPKPYSAINNAVNALRGLMSVCRIRRRLAPDAVRRIFAPYAATSKINGDAIEPISTINLASGNRRHSCPICQNLPDAEARQFMAAVRHILEIHSWLMAAVTIAGPRLLSAYLRPLTWWPMR